MLRRSILSACMVTLALGIPAMGHAQNDSPTKDIYFTFSQPVTVPEGTLPAGRYLFRHIGANTGRTTLQILSGDGGRFARTIMTARAARSTAADKPEIRFMETSADFAPAVSTWWYPGQTEGWEFIYPREQALKLAKSSSEPVLTTAAAADAKSGDLVRVDESGAESPYSAAAEPAPVPIVGTAQRGEFADQASGAAAPVAAANPRDNAGMAGRTTLPQTASSAPTVALAGMLALIAAVGMGLWRRRAA